MRDRENKEYENRLGIGSYGRVKAAKGREKVLAPLGRRRKEKALFKVVGFLEDNGMDCREYSNISEQIREYMKILKYT